jgi:hypothetical protein
VAESFDNLLKRMQSKETGQPTEEEWQAASEKQNKERRDRLVSLITEEGARQIESIGGSFGYVIGDIIARDPVHAEELFAAAKGIINGLHQAINPNKSPEDTLRIITGIAYKAQNG